MSAAANPVRLAVVGNPVSHSRSPQIHARFAAASGHAVDYTRIEAPLDGFVATLRAFADAGARGCNVTVPFKGEAFAACARLSERARRAQAVNTIVFDGEGWLGDNTDGAGLVRDIELNAGVGLRGRRVLVLGAGGAAAGALDPLLATRPAALVVANRTLAKGQALVERFAASAARLDVPLSAAALETPGAGFDVLINATAASLQATVPPLPAGTLKPGALALDMMYGAAALPFLRWARAQGAVARDGLGMLVEQAAEAYFVWMGVRPSTFQVLTELRREVDAQAAKAGASA
ncbi:shikimate dehydrogenase [Scleromatobacter humisilvae]|uniref:Shikimate dehydrogenase (NADP(+)) n=1 Tax=Scleromatobacter humisilvae TaxID=2897159 RepID=A0A9X1YP62_9BURK|nr:shikimate dehydrogenase [Scleromatobacter humisilvae]MCK9688453.1 shikimate dehydrogenase [Scleromatobacter humisilvae]